MKRLDTSKHITRFVMFLFITYACLLTLPLFAALDIVTGNGNHNPNVWEVLKYQAFIMIIKSLVWHISMVWSCSVIVVTSATAIVVSFVFQSLDTAG